jgi:3-mercaptopyruvate sulfurtransferase SseA
MRFILSISAAATLGLSVLTGCQNSAAPVKIESAKTTANTTVNTTAAPPKTDEHGHADEAPRITLADAKKDFDAGNVVFIDTRAEATYKQEHVKGAINIPMEAVEAKYKEIPTGKKIIAYCS